MMVRLFVILGYKLKITVILGLSHWFFLKYLPFSLRYCNADSYETGISILKSNLPTSDSCPYS